MVVKVLWRDGSRLPVESGNDISMEFTGLWRLVIEIVFRLCLSGHADFPGYWLLIAMTTLFPG
jgi:hypothetical protein